MPAQPTNATQVILRDGRARRGPQRVPRVDLRLYPTRYTRSDVFRPGGLGTSEIDPHTGNNGVLVQDYAGSPWAGESSAGISGAVSMVNVGPAAPAVGASLNGHPSADFVAANSEDLNSVGGGPGHLLGDFISETSGMGGCVVEFTAALPADPGAGSRFATKCIFDDNGGTGYYLCAHDGGITFGLSSATVAYECTYLFAITTGVRYYINWYHDGVNLYLRVDNNAWQVEPGDAIATALLAQYLRFGVNGGGGGYTSMRMWAFFLSPNTPVIEDNLDGYGAHYQTLFAEDFGFPTNLPDQFVPSTAIDIIVGPSEIETTDIVLFAGLEDEPPPVPEVVPDFFGFAIFPDVVVRPRPQLWLLRSVEQHPDEPPPPATTPFAPTVQPDRVARATRTPVAHQQPFATSLRFEPTSFEADFPDRVTRVLFRVVNQMHHAAFDPDPERTTPIAIVDVPARVTRALYRSIDQQAATTLSPKPERTSVDFEADAPDRIPRALFRTALQQHVAAFDPEPERQRPAFDAHGPVRIVRPRYEVAQQQALTTIAPRPERATHFDVIEPDRIARALFRTVDQQHALSVPPKPEQLLARTWHTSHPDRVVRPTMPAALQPFFAFAPQPERTSTFFAFDGPSRIVRPSLDVARQPSRAELPHQPERTSINFEADAPDRITRPTFPSAQQQTYASAIAPERTLPLAWSPGFVDAVPRAKVHASQQPFFAMWPVPLPVAALTQLQPIHVIAPERIARPAFPSAQQQASLSVPPRILPQTPYADAFAPVRAVRPIAQQPTYAVMQATLERTATFFDALAPERVVRARYAVAQQPSQLSVMPFPERKVPLVWTSYEPPLARRRAQQPAPMTVTIAPLDVVPFPHAIHPSLVRWPVFAREGGTTRAEALKAPFLDFFVEAPARGLQRRQERVVGLDVAMPITQPAPPAAPLLLLSVYPDRITRAWVPVRARLVLDFELPEPATPTITGVKGALVPHAYADGEVLVEAIAKGGLTVKLEGAGALDDEGHAKGATKPVGGAGGGLTTRKGVGGKLGK